MSYRKIFSTASPLAIAIGMSIAATSTASANLMFPDYGSFKGATVSGSEFSDHLAREYQELSVYEYQDMYDYWDAETYAERGISAMNGVVPQPFIPSNWDIEERDAMRDLVDARAELVAALDNGAGTIAPSVAAEAQASYDCWVEQQEEGWQHDHIANCRTGFKLAMDQLAAAMAPIVEPAAKIEPVAPAMTEVGRFVVYFDFDDATLNDEGLTKVESVVSELSNMKDIKIFVEGHADRAGPADYNKELAERRAEQVRAELIRNGLEVSLVESFDVESEGETEPAVATGDGVREQRNRRVEIIVNGTVVPQQEATLEQQSTAAIE